MTVASGFWKVNDLQLNKLTINGSATADMIGLIVCDGIPQATSDGNEGQGQEIQHLYLEITGDGVKSAYHITPGGISLPDSCVVFGFSLKFPY